MEISIPRYDKLRNWIREARENEISWEEIKFLRKADSSELAQEINRKIINDFWPNDTNVQLWALIVESEEDTERKKQNIMLDKAMLTDESTENGVVVPSDSNSSWILYKRHLLDSGWSNESVEEIESATLQILRQLNGEPNSKIVKGLVVGHVQSGKTANMAALMAMAADWKWNMFIVLSGTIDNLRKQTHSRLFKDLYRPGNIFWSGLEHLSLNSSHGQRSQDLNFEKNSPNRYFTVCLKNSTRLTNLIKWLQADKKKLSQMRVIVIDDESDQGGVNTARISQAERSTINRLIVSLVEGNQLENKKNKSKKYEEKKFDTMPGAMNYIGYTATPYANFLNESGRESLYPRNFIRTLQPSNEYFGAKQIFGIEGTENFEGLNIKRVIPKDELEQMKKLHEGDSEDLPNTVVESLVWFLCASAAMRWMGYKKPVSMLVHTSQRQEHHKNVAYAIEKWIVEKKGEDSFKEICQEVWENETEELTVASFYEGFSEYPDENKINDYPKFESIYPEIINLVNIISHIMLDEDRMLEYHQGIHLCIDNCANRANDDNAFVRLAYPDADNLPETAPVFIVVGGSTLSRGLTIEGLVSTFFLRASNQVDSLMQMGRWFGYRRGYELYPRIWMTEDTIKKFGFLAQLEADLRDDLRQFMDGSARPVDFGPRVKNSPRVSWMKITAKNRMQGAVVADMDFSGTNIQTVLFEQDKEVLENNLFVTKQFLERLGEGSLSDSGDSIVWRGVSFSNLKENLLTPYKFHPNASVFNRIDTFSEWFEKSIKEAGYTNWNIVVAGTDPSKSSDTWNVPGGCVGKIERSKKQRSIQDNSINIGVLRAPKDLLEDVKRELINEEEWNPKSSSDNEYVRAMRKKAGLDKTPLLIIYRIDKNSEYKEQGKSVKNKGNQREKLNALADIIGISIWIPGAKSKNIVKSLTVELKKEDFDIDDEIGETDDTNEY